MSIDIDKTMLTITLSMRDYRTIRGLVAERQRRIRRYVAKRPPFVPEPGKLDLSKVQDAQLTSIYNTLDQAIGAAIEEDKQP